MYEDKTYWTAECTPAEDWKVGDQPSSLASAEAVIIPLSSTEQSSPAQVSSSLDTPLLPSSITVNLSQAQSPNTPVEQSIIGENTGALAISGSISPAYSGAKVSIYVSSGVSFDHCNTVTDYAGGYMLTWNFTSAGTYYITTSWSGASNYAGADSETLTVFIGPDSFVQFNSTDSNYIFVQANLANYEISSLQGVNDFLSIPLGKAVSFSYDFTVVQAGQTVSNVQTETITIPASTETMVRGRTPIGTLSTPAETEIIPINVPSGLEPLILPADFDQTINNQFCFILQNNSGNYSLNVSALNDDELSNTSCYTCNTAFMNASENVKENVWYHVTESMSDNGITASLYNTNGTLIDSAVTPYDAMTSNEMIMFITSNVDSAVILKDLTVQALNNATPSRVSNEKTTNESGLLLLYVGFSFLLVASFSVTLAYLKKKKTKETKNTQITFSCIPLFMFLLITYLCRA